MKPYENLRFVTIGMTDPHMGERRSEDARRAKQDPEAGAAQGWR